MPPQNMDRAVLIAARTVLLRDARATMAAIAEEAGMGVAGLYRRYANKQTLLQAVAADNYRRYVAFAEAALSDTDDPWHAFTDFLRHVLDEGLPRLTVALRGEVTFDQRLSDLDKLAVNTTNRLLRAARGSGALRPEVTRADITVLLEQLGRIDVGDDVRSAALRRRYLTLVCDGLRADSATRRLPGPPPHEAELLGRWA
ncbi:AcrR family transcriptional regulator [Nocardioides luteus]|uniref:TetR family transcriptional regulator n=1 Tax=Nocardioides luteus TaxID=1844 RepID=A0ABQ5T2I1_9ACTN|nr:TetR/AcrR family transcriptional regulator [Nocardioides luteus]MDR7309007.1 AcrR family transcriptional regulator [Nocardioides luteus]GGR71216.1 TetR family transcriptional regulator [Nocardioides luteus]GLJ70687.1 TetR family transcriptional regulator [Nocardioides luteus]